MSGSYLFGLIALSMAWLLAILMLAANFVAWRAARRAPPGAPRPSGIPFLPGILGSVTVFFTRPISAGFLIATIILLELIDGSYLLAYDPSQRSE